MTSKVRRCRERCGLFALAPGLSVADPTSRQAESAMARKHGSRRRTTAARSARAPRVHDRLFLAPIGVCGYEAGAARVEATLRF